MKLLKRLMMMETKALKWVVKKKLQNTFDMVENHLEEVEEHGDEKVSGLELSDFVPY